MSSSFPKLTFNLFIFRKFPMRILILFLFSIVLISCSITSIDKGFIFNASDESDSQPIKWITSIGHNRSDASFVPAIIGSDIYASTSDGSIAKLNLCTGDMFWKVSVPARLSSGVGTDGFTVAVASEEGEVFSFDSNGKLKWSKKIGNWITDPPIVAFGIIVIKNHNCCIQAFDSETGECLWKLQHPYQTQMLSSIFPSRMILIEDLIFVGVFGGKVLVISISNGEIRWEGEVSSCPKFGHLDCLTNFIGTPHFSGNTLCAFSHQDRMACFNTLDEGKKVWSHDLSSIVDIAMDENLLYSISERNIVNAFKVKDGSSVWKQDKLKNRYLNNLSVSGNFLIVTAPEGYLYFLSKENGSLIKSHFLQGIKKGFTVSSISTIPNKGLIIQTESGHLMFFECF